MDGLSIKKNNEKSLKVTIPENLDYTNIFDEYYLNIDNVGLNGENYLIVGCIPGTKDIVSMYPIKYNPIKKVRS